MTWSKLFIQMTHSSVKLTVFKAELNTAVPKPHSPVLSILVGDVLSDLETYKPPLKPWSFITAIPNI